MGKLKSRLFLWIERALARCTDKIVCISEAEQESALRNNIVERDKLDEVILRMDSLKSSLEGEIKRRKSAERKIADLTVKLKYANS